MFQTNFVEKIKTQNFSSEAFFRKSYARKCGRTKQDTEDNIRRRSITKATNTHSEYVILTAFPRQKWLRRRAWMLCYTTIAGFFCNIKIAPTLVCKN
jgi:hypothetical protein